MVCRSTLNGWCTRCRSGNANNLALAFDLVTTNGARALGIADYGLTPGAKADFVVIDAAHVQEAVVARPVRKAVYKAGKLVAQDGAYCGA